MEYLRDATERDIDLLFDWANETSVRAASFNSHEIEYEEHKKWFKDLLSRDDAKQYIFVQGNEPIGQIRIYVNDTEAEIGYSICAEKRGAGYGKEMVSLLVEQMKKDFPKVKKLTAKVKPGNAASQKVFLDIGYVEKYRFYELEIDKIENG